jgi:hypothetical protein
MPKRIVVIVSEPHRVILERWSKRASKLYLQERAKAILMVASGIPVSQVAQLLRLRIHRNAVSEWVKRFIAEGPEGLKIRKGRGRKSAFSPPQPTAGRGQVDLHPASVTASVSDCPQSLASARP